MRFRCLVLALAFLATIASDSWGQSKRPPTKGQQEQTQPQEQKATPDQRGTEQLPLVVQPLPTKKTADIAKQEKRDSDEKTNSDWWTLRLAVWTVVALFGQLAVFIAQAFYLKGTLRATADAAKAAITATDHIKTVERAFVKISHVAPGIAPDGSGLFWIRISIKNFGRTPATISDVVLNRVVLPHGNPLPQMPQYERQDFQIPRGFLVADEEIFFGTFYRITVEEMTDVMGLQSDLYLIGCVDYRDQFGNRHRAGYARVYMPMIDDRASYEDDAAYVARSNLVFVMEDGYNYDRPRTRDEGNDWDEVRGTMPI